MSPAYDPDRYSLLRQKLIVYLERRECWEAEDLADEAITRALARPKEEPEPRQFDAFVFGILKNVHKEWLRRVHRDEEIDHAVKLDHVDRNPRAAECARLCIGRVSAEEREFLEQYYIDGMKARAMATVWGLTDSGIRGRAFQLIRRIEACMAKCLGK